MQREPLTPVDLFERSVRQKWTLGGLFTGLRSNCKVILLSQKRGIFFF